MAQYIPAVSIYYLHRIKLDAFRADFELQVLGAIKVIKLSYPILRNHQVPQLYFFQRLLFNQDLTFIHKFLHQKAIELTRSLAAELAPKIRVNAIAPSLTDTLLASKLLGTDEKKRANAERHPLKKIGTSENIADVAQFLLSEKSQWMSGQIMAIDGGISTLRV